MKTAMMTLGCPDWTFEQIVSRAREYGFDAIDWRGVGPDLDITVTSRFTTELTATRNILDQAGLATSCISSSLRVCDPLNYQKNLDEARRTIDVGRGLGAGCIRVFGGGESLPHAQGIETGRRMFDAILACDGANDFTWAFETHDHWVHGRDVIRLMDGVNHPAVGVLWDMAHTARVAGESPEQTCSMLGRRIRYVHVKDAVREPALATGETDGWRYVLPGRGTLPIEQGVLRLRQMGYEGYLCFEHEKRWHPALPDPQEVFPAFINWVKKLPI